MFIDIEGFQIIKKATIEVKGITLLVGDTNHGKSAMCRAVVCALFGTTGTDFINQEMDYTKVGILLDAEEKRNEDKVIWQKTAKGKVRYEINGDDLTKTGKKGPVEMLEDIGISTFKVRKSAENLIYWKQLSEPFVVFKPNTYVFEVISSIMEDRKVYPVLKAIISENKTIKESIISIEGTISAHRIQLSSQSELYKKLYEVYELKPTFERIRATRIQLQGFEQNIKDLSSIETFITQCDSMLSDTEGFLSRFGDLTEIENSFNNLMAFEAVLKSFIGVCYELNEVDEEITKVNAASGVIQADAWTKSLQELWDLSYFYTQLSDITSRIDLETNTMSGLVEKLNLAIVEFDTFKDQVGICPLCKKPYGDADGNKQPE